MRSLARLRACAEEGRCAFDPDVDPYACSRPDAPSTGGCAATWACRAFGRCVPHNGGCGVDPARVPDSLACRYKGACAPVSMLFGPSRDLGVTAETCAASLECVHFGRCTPEWVPPLATPRNCSVDGDWGGSWRCLMFCQPGGACVQGERESDCLREAELPVP